MKWTVTLVAEIDPGLVCGQPHADRMESHWPARYGKIKVCVHRAWRLTRDGCLVGDLAVEQRAIRQYLLPTLQNRAPGVDRRDQLLGERAGPSR
jgi:hypothetical protein